MAACASVRSRDPVTKVLAWVGGVLAAVVIATGVYVTVRYRPDASGFALGVQRLHAFASIVLAVVVVVGLAALVWERRPDRRHGLPAFAVVAVLAVVLWVEARLGWGLAWNQVRMYAVIGGETLHRVRGVLLRDLPVEHLIVGTTEYSVGAFRRRVWAHAVILPVLIGAGVGFVVLWTRRFANPGARPPRPVGSDEPDG